MALSGRLNGIKTSSEWQYIITCYRPCQLSWRIRIRLRTIPSEGYGADNFAANARGVWYIRKQMENVKT